MIRKGFIPFGQLAIVLMLAFYFSFRNIEGLEVGTDEGVHAFAAKTLAFKGHYALETSDDFLDFDRRIAVGPTVIVPTALVYKYFGFGLWQTRTVVGIFFLLFMITFFYLAKRCFNQTVAFFSSLLVLASLWPFWQELSLYTPINRILIGEAAALFFLCLGSLIYITGLRRKGYLHASLGALIIGTAVLTKPQFILSIFPTLTLLLIHFKKNEMTLSKKTLVASLSFFSYFLPSLIWILVQWDFFGFDTFFEVLFSYSAFEKQFIHFSARTIKQNIVDRWSELMPNATRLFFILPALAYGWHYTLKRGIEKNFFSFFCLVFATVWLAWFPFSKGFIRYAIPGLFFAHIFLALYFYEEFQKRNIFAVTLFSLLILYGFYVNNRELKQTFEKDSKNMARYIEKNIPKEAVIETTELDYAVDLFLKERRLKHAPAGIRELISAYKKTHNPADGGVNYIITDPIDKTYEFTLRNYKWQEITKFGDRVLFKLED